MDTVFKIGVNALVVKDGMVLMGKRLKKSGYGMYGYPGGHLEYNEAIVDALKRELFEETALVAEQFEFSSVINTPEDENHYIQINFVVTEYSGELENKEPEKCAGWQWFDIQNLPEDIYIPHKDFMKAHVENIKLLDT